MSTGATSATRTARAAGAAGTTSRAPGELGHGDRTPETVGWLDVTGGVSGDMLLGACVDAGADISVLRYAVAALRLPDEMTLDVETVERGGLRARRVHVTVADTAHDRRLVDVLEVLAGATDLEAAVRDRAADVFRTLAAAEARVHGRPVDEVHFHEVGALDSLADVVGSVAGLHALGIDRLVCGEFALGGGRVRTAHGMIPVPGPAVLELVREAGAPCRGGPVDAELATPTGVAVAVTLADEFGPLPPMRPGRIGLGAGSRDHVGHANVTRLVVGQAQRRPGSAIAPAPSSARTHESVVLAANVDDLDPRLWPPTLEALFAAGAADAWLTPILMKKGRPAHTVTVLCEENHVESLRDVLFSHTTTIGLRQQTVTKLELAREEIRVLVAGRPVRVKVASYQGRVVNASVEYSDVVAVAAATGLAPKLVLELARSRCADAVYADLV